MKQLQFIDQFALQHFDLAGDAIADEHADRATSDASLGRDTVKFVLGLHALMQAVQRRLVAVLFEISRTSPRQSITHPLRTPPLPRSFFVVRLAHPVVTTHSSASCSRCLTGAHCLSVVKFWLGIICV